MVCYVCYVFQFQQHFHHERLSPNQHCHKFSEKRCGAGAGARRARAKPGRRCCCCIPRILERSRCSWSDEMTFAPPLHCPYTPGINACERCSLLSLSQARTRPPTSARSPPALAASQRPPVAPAGPACWALRDGALVIHDGADPEPAVVPRREGEDEPEVAHHRRDGVGRAVPDAVRRLDDLRRVVREHQHRHESRSSTWCT